MFDPNGGGLAAKLKADVLRPVAALTEQLADNVKKGWTDTAKAGEDWLLCGKRSLDRALQQNGQKGKAGAAPEEQQPQQQPQQQQAGSSTKDGRSGRSTALVVRE